MAKNVEHIQFLITAEIQKFMSDAEENDNRRPSFLDYQNLNIKLREIVNQDILTEDTAQMMSNIAEWTGMTLKDIERKARFGRLVDSFDTVEYDRPKVPEYVARWIEKNRKSIGDIFDAFNMMVISDTEPEEVGGWARLHPDKFAIAYITGKYHIIHEKKYVVKMPLGDDNYTLLTKEKGTDNYSFLILGKCSELRADYQQKFTEEEIEKVDATYMEFAIPVEEFEL